MLSVKSITTKKINLLNIKRTSFFVLLSGCFTLCSVKAFSQDNSPYSRYGLGDIVPSTNVNSRGMGGISAGYSDILSINFNNPASYGSFQTIKEQAAKKIARGRAILDVGINLQNHTLREPNNTEKFSSGDAIFSHVQVGLPLRPNLGISFGLRPLTHIGYNIASGGGLYDPSSGHYIDSAVTNYEGDGGAYLASAGIGKKFLFSQTKLNALSLGFNVGYLFGQQNYSSRRSILNDSLLYNSANFQTDIDYGNLFFNVGLQYQVALKENLALTLGAQGNWKQDLNASKDIIRETFFFDESTGVVRLDSTFDQRNVKGEITYPGSYNAGFILEKYVTNKEAGWLFGVDYGQTKWSDYRSYGQADSTLRDSWQLRTGIQLRPVPKANYFSNVSYRVGAFLGQDYIYVNDKLPVFGATFGLGLPLRNFSRQNEQYTLINLAFEFINRGNNKSELKDNLFRISAGFSLSDLWFVKRKYD